MTFLQDANLRLEKRLVEAAAVERAATQPLHDNKANDNNKCDNNVGSKNSNGSDDGRCRCTCTRTCAPADNFWDVINRARGLRPDESNIFGAGTT